MNNSTADKNLQKPAVSTPTGNVTCHIGEENSFVLVFGGNWTLGSKRAGIKEVLTHISSSQGTHPAAFETSNLDAWDSTFVATILNLLAEGKKSDVMFEMEGLPEGVQRLIALATSVPERQGARRLASNDGFLTRIGKSYTKTYDEIMEFITFLGDATTALVRFSLGKAKFRRVDLMLTLEECGPKALPIVTLISVLIGLILAFVGAIQLRQFGAQIYVADLVAIAMAREMAAIMTGIIMAGRTGAAFAAQLGTMQVNEEIDAFRTLGFSPMEFLVLPRMLALIVMMPLLCIYANLLGILGGAVVGVGMLGLTPTEYYVETLKGVSLTDFSIGIFKSVIFGVIVAISGCLKGIQSGRSASAVGDAATSAVVMAIVLIIVFDGLFAVVTNIIGI